MAKVILKGICKQYGTVDVVKDFNLEINDQEMVVITYVVNKAYDVT